MFFDVTFGVCLLVVVWSLILFTAWSSLVHATVLGYQRMRGMVVRGVLSGVGVLVVIGVALIALAPAKQVPVDRAAP
jgi:hypothetical protein